MPSIRNIKTNFWTTPFVVELDSDTKLLFIYSWTNEHSEISGLYRLSPVVIKMETGLTEDRMEKSFRRLWEGNKVFYLNNWIWVKNFIKHQNFDKNPNIMISVKKQWEAAPDFMKELKEKVITNIIIPFPNPFNTLSEGLPNPSAGVLYKDKDKDKEDIKIKRTELLRNNSVANEEEKNNGEAPAEPVLPNLNPLIDLFKHINPSYEKFFKNTTQRAALERLVKKHGEEKIGEIILVCVKTNGIKYAPTITSPLELENKLGTLVSFIRKEKDGEKKKGITIQV